MTGCLSDLAAALVDGELDHAAREKAQRHLLHCDACRAEVDLQRRLKARLRHVDEPSPSDALTARLLALPATAPLAVAGGPAVAGAAAAPAAPPVGPAPTATPAAASGTASAPPAGTASTGGVERPVRSGPRRASADDAPRTARRAPRSDAPAAAAGRRSRRRLVRRSAAGSAVAVLGVSAALAMGAPPQRPATTPVGPTSDAFVTELVSTTSDGASGPLTSVPATRAGVGSTFAPLTGGALLSSRGDRSAR